MNPNLFRLERIQISDPENLLRPVTGSVLIRRFRHVLDIVVRVRFPCRFTYSMKLVERNVEGEERCLCVENCNAYVVKIPPRVMLHNSQ